VGARLVHQGDVAGVQVAHGRDKSDPATRFAALRAVRGSTSESAWLLLNLFQTGMTRPAEWLRLSVSVQACRAGDRDILAAQ
jgi:hypothetical protein